MRIEPGVHTWGVSWEHEPPTIVSTWLSLPPRNGSYGVSVASVAAVAVCSVAAWKGFGGEGWAAVPRLVFEEHQYWRLFSAMFAHADFMHFFSNAVPLAVLSYFLFGAYGAWVHPVAMVPLGRW